MQERPIASQIFSVSGMSCGHCERAVTAAVRQLDAQALVSIDLASGRVEVQSQLERADVAKAIAAQGYAVA